MGNFNRLNLCLLVAAAVALPGIAHAAYTANPRQPTTYWIGSDGGWRSSVTVEARGAGLPTKYLKTTVPLSVGSLGRLVKAAMGGPVGIALTAAMVGYAVWDGSGFTTEPETAVHERPAEGWQNITTSCVDGTGYEAGYRATYGYGYTGIYDAPSMDHSDYPPPPAGALYLDKCWYISSKTAKYFIVTTTTDPEIIEAETLPPVALTDEEVGQYIASNPTLTQQIANDAIDRNTWRDGNWPEMQTATDSIATALDSVESGTATADDQAIEQTATAQPAPAPQQSTSAEWPTFCSWASVVCDFIDWYKAPGEPPTHPDLPVEEVTLSTWESGLGAGSCPAPYTTEFQGQTISYPFDDACWAAESVIRPLLLTLSLIGAGLIIVGRS